MNPKITYIRWIEPEHVDFVGNCSAIDPQTDAEQEAWVRSQLEAGNEAAWCCAVVKAEIEFERMVARYEQYPALDEMDWSAREYEAAQEYWAGCSIRERLDLIKGTDVSPFAARRGYIPEDDDGSIYQRCLPD